MFFPRSILWNFMAQQHPAEDYKPAAVWILWGLVGPRGLLELLPARRMLSVRLYRLMGTPALPSALHPDFRSQSIPHRELWRKLLLPCLHAHRVILQRVYRLLVCFSLCCRLFILPLSSMFSSPLERNTF